MESPAAVTTPPLPDPLRPARRSASPETQGEPSDAALVERMAAREAAALEELHRRYAPILQALAMRMLRNPEDAQDAVQEAFAQAWRLAPRYRCSLASVSTWLGMMTRSRALDYLRRRRTRPESPLADEGRVPEETEPAQGTERILHAERRRRVREALSRIPPSQRKVLELRFWEGLTQTEIAAEIGIPLGTVKTRTLLALKKLRKGLADEIRDLL
jgi:RNA polymerase sigma-70 factor (ECF subfamily)